MNDEEAVQSEIDILKEKIILKNQRIFELLDRIQDLEDNIVSLEESIKNKEENPDNPILTLKNIKLEEQEKEIRRLKDNLGYFRKENLELKRKLRDETDIETDGISRRKVIRIEEKKPNLEEMLEEIQTNLSKKNISMKNLEEKANRIKQEIKKKDEIINVLEEENAYLESLIREKDDKISDLKESVINLELMYSKLLKSSKNDKNSDKNTKSEEEN